MKKVHKQEEDGTNAVVGVPLDVQEIHPELPPLNVSWQHIDPDRLSVLQNPLVALPRKGRPRRTRRLKTSAEIVQKAADRMEKVSRSLSESSQAPDTKERVPVTDDNEAMAEDDEVDDCDERDAHFKVMWADALSLM
ncbi:hypothetical protein V1504DRAFT_436770 [Lipomyces starkeyi]